MAKGILLVETRPSSPEEAAAYHDWYDNTHLREIVATEGFVAARRYAPVEGDGPFVAVYEIEAPDLDAAVAEMNRRIQARETTRPVGMQTDPPPIIRLLREMASYPD